MQVISVESAQLHTYTTMHIHESHTQSHFARTAEPYVENQNHQRKLLYDHVDKNTHKMHYRQSLDYRRIALSWVSRSDF